MTERIFDPYVRSTESTGIGLGLATVRRLAEAHGGKVGVFANHDGPGSTFWFELPTVDAETAPKRAGSVRNRPAWSN